MPVGDHMTHADLEDLLAGQGREVLRQLLQDRMELRALREKLIPAVVDSRGVPRTHTVRDQACTLTTIFGDVRVPRLAYRRRGFSNLCPADAELNLPSEQYFHGLRHRSQQGVLRRGHRRCAPGDPCLGRRTPQAPTWWRRQTKVAHCIVRIVIRRCN